MTKFKPSPHAAAVDAHERLLAKNQAKREELEAKLEQAQQKYLAWRKPQDDFKAADKELSDFYEQDALEQRESEGAVVKATDPLIEATIDEVNYMHNENCRRFDFRLTDGPLPVQTSNREIILARNEAIIKARNELRALQHVKCDDVRAAVREIMSAIPSLQELALCPN